MPEDSNANDERPCLHCLIGDVIDDFYAEFGSLNGELATIDTGELLSMLAKTFAEITFDSDIDHRRRMMEDFICEVTQFEAEFREAQKSETPRSDARH